VLIEPDTEVVQSYPRRQTCPQSTHLVRALPPEAESVEQLLVDALRDLADRGNPPPQALGPGFTAVALRRVDDARPVTIEPSLMVFFALETLV
jgi:hypothetical protein